MNIALATFAVIGHPIAHSRSPDIHAAFAKQLGIELQYKRIDAQPSEFEAIVADFFNSGGQGLNVTVPFKERAWELARTHLSERAKLAGAVNTLWASKQGLHGCNTDGVGLVRDLQRLQLINTTARAMPCILLLGAGGAAKGVIGPLLDTGCARLHVANRTALRAHELRQAWLEHRPADSTRLSSGGLTDLPQQAWDLVINATASSLQGQAPELPNGLYDKHTGAYDMMYGTNPTAFLMHARSSGVTQLADGLGMLVEQAAESFRIWHGVLPETASVIATIRTQMQAAVR
jgi:shikimate dehydrogenase